MAVPALDDLIVTVHEPPELVQPDEERVPLVVVIPTHTPEALFDSVALIVEVVVPSAGTDEGVAETVILGLTQPPQS